MRGSCQGGRYGLFETILRPWALRLGEILVVSLALTSGRLIASNVPSGTSLNTGNALYTNLVAAWPINEGSGTTTTDSRNSIACTLSSSGANQPTWGTGDGVGGHVLHFQAGASLNSYLDCGTPVPVQDIGVGGLSASFAFRVLINNAGGMKMAQRNDGNSVQVGWWLGDFGFVHEFSNNNCYHYGATSITTASYHTVIMTWDGSASSANILAYVDGTLYASWTSMHDAIGTTATDASFHLLLGNENVTGNLFTSGSLDGNLSWFYIWTNRVLSSTEVTSLTNSPFQIFNLASLRNLPLLGVGEEEIAISGTVLIGLMGVAFLRRK